MGDEERGVSRWTDLANVYCAGLELLAGYLSAKRNEPYERGRVILVKPLVSG